MALKSKLLSFIFAAGIGFTLYTGSSVAGGPPWTPPSAAQCMFQSNLTRLDYRLTSNTLWDQCREAYRRYKGINIKITGTVRQKSTMRSFSINHQDLLTPGKYIYPMVNTASGMKHLYSLDPKEYMIIGYLDVSESWRK
ncbi:hypothetical protein AAL09_12640 [Salmonella enterica subsp. enterica serovar Newport]|nr:hypothetical protein [Salmonella enterica subsp. enterica serovar Newport]